VPRLAGVPETGVAAMSADWLDELDGLEAEAEEAPASRIWMATLLGGCGVR
jgi:hypothetical protein